MFPDIETLIPHRAPMRWIDALTDCTETTASATASFRAEDFAVADGFVQETALVECVAQTVAAAAGHRQQSQAEAGGLSAKGMLVAVSGFHIKLRPPAGEQLLIQVRQLKRFGLLTLISGIVSCKGQTVASGELTLYA